MWPILFEGRVLNWMGLTDGRVALPAEPRPVRATSSASGWGVPVAGRGSH